MIPRLFRSAALLCACLLPVAADAAPDLAAIVADVRARVAAAFPAERVANLPPGTVEALLTPEERAALATGYLGFQLDAPGRVTVWRDARLAPVGEPFWLEDLGFVPAPYSVRAYQQEFEAWSRDFPAGEVGLGVHALRTIREHYFVSVGPVGGRRPGVDAPDTGVFADGASPWTDRTAPLEAVPGDFAGDVLVRTDSDRRTLAAVYDHFRVTRHPASDRPDQIVATLTATPSTSLAVQWRTGPAVGRGVVRIRPMDAPPAAAREVVAATTRIEAPRTLNQPLVLRHTVLLADLAPDTAHRVEVGDGSPDGWSTPRTFRTAPVAPSVVRFLAFGDVQEGYATFRALWESALRTVPDAGFAVFAGDLVSRGNDSDDWDAFFAVLDEVGAPLPIVPAVGNHELLPGEAPDLYRRIFVLPENGPPGLEPGRAYTLDFAGVRLLVLDSNLEGGQAAWMEERLRAWREEPLRPVVAVAHHGAYTSRPGRYHPMVRERWAPILEGHGVPLVLQGHDHAYLRTHPTAPEHGGTTWLIATAGGKFYPQARHDYAARAFAETPTFQVVTASALDGSLQLQTFDTSGRLLDEAELRP